MEQLKPISRKRKTTLEKVSKPIEHVASGKLRRESAIMGVLMHDSDSKHGVRIPKVLGNLDAEQSRDVFTTMIGSLMLKGITDVQHMIAATGGLVHPNEVRTAMNKVRLRWQVEGTLRDQAEYRGQHLSKLSAVEQRLWALMDRKNSTSLELQILKTLIATIDSQSALVGLNKQSTTYQQNIQHNHYGAGGDAVVRGSAIVANGESLHKAARKLQEMMKLEQAGNIS